MQPCSREMEGGMNLNCLLNDNVLNNNISPSHHQLSLQDLHNSIHGAAHFDPAAGDQDFLDQMFSTINPSWADLNSADCPEPPADTNGNPVGPFGTHFDESAVLAMKLRQHQISGSGGSSSSLTSAAAAAKALLLQQQMLMSRGFDSSHSDVQGVDESVQALYNGFGGSIHGGGSGGGGGQPLNSSPQIHHPQGGTTSFGAQGQATNPAPAASGSTTTASGGGGNTCTGQQRPKVRARRGQATDPHSIAERLRRERIAERMKALQELVPNGNKTDKASMLDEIIDYVKFLQLQVKVLSMSRLGGAAAVAPLAADMSSEGGGGDCVPANGGGRNGNGSANDSLTVTEHQVAKLMEEDMGSAMQYLQGKGLCLMPISLAAAISTSTCHSGRPLAANPNPNPLAASNGDGPTSPSMSVMTAQSATVANGGAPDGYSAKEAASVPKS